MISVSSNFTAGINSNPAMPLEYLIKISEDGGVNWAAIPDGAGPALPLGTVSGETEVTPFEFVGPDCEITCENISGYWTNEAKTGKLDTGYQIRIKVETRPAGATDYVTHIKGAVDLATVQPIDSSHVVFTIRGALNLMDEIFATYVLADRPATYPHKMNGWLQILSVGALHPEGLFELKYNGREKALSWNQGIAQSINTDDDIVLVGIGGKTLTVRNLRYTPDVLSIPGSDDISQWIAIKTVSAALGAYQPYPALSMANFETKVDSTVDFNDANVEALDLVGVDKNVLNYLPDTIGTYATGMARLGISHITSVRDFYLASPEAIISEWFISSPAGPFKGLWMLRMQNGAGGEMAVSALIHYTGSGALGDDATVVASCKVGDYMYLLYEDTATPQHTYLNTINSWGIHKYFTDGDAWYGVKYAAGTGSIYWRSFCAHSEDNLYACIVTSGDNAKVNHIDFSGATLTITPKTGTAFDTGVSMVPAIISLGQFYIACTAALDTAGVKTTVYLQIYDIANNISYAITTPIEKDNSDLEYAKYGPCMMSRLNIATDIGAGTIVESLGFYLLLAPMLYNSDIKKQLGSSDTDLYKVIINDNVNPLVKVVGEVKKKVTAIAKDRFYTAYFAPNVIGLTLVWTSGSNIGQTKTITAQDISVNPGSPIETKITVASDFTNIIAVFDEFKIYKGTFDLTGAGYTYKLTDKKGINFLKSTEPVVDGQSNPGIAADGNSYYNMTDDIALIAKNINHGHVVAADYSRLNHKLLLATEDMFIMVGTDVESPMTLKQLPQVYDADFGSKSLRDAIQEIALSANCRIMPSEHNNKLTLIHKGLTTTGVFALTADQYRFGNTYNPFYNYKAVTVNGKTYGTVYNNKYDYILNLTCDNVPDCLSLSLAKDIYDHLGSGDRIHVIETDMQIWLEPGDCGTITLPGGTTINVMILGYETDFESRTHTLTLLEF